MIDTNRQHKLLFSLLITFIVITLNGCVSSNNVFGVIKNAPEVKMIGKTFEEVENEYGPFSMAYFDNGRASYIFEKTSISFYFDNIDAVSLWKEELNTASIPAAIALKSIKSTDVCTGVAGRVKDFGLTDPKLLENRISTADTVISENDESYYLIPIDGTPLMLVVFDEYTGVIEAGSRLLVTDAAFTPIKKEIEQGSSSSVATATPSVKKVRIIDVEAGDYHTVGLREDGTVVAVGDNSSRQCEVDMWTEIIKISAGRGHTVGLRVDGIVYDTYPATAKIALGWKDVIDVAAGDYLTVGLFSDGTVKVASSDNYFGECNVEAWTDIVDIAAGNSHVVGLRSDGTVVATGLSASGQCDVSEWKDIVSIDASGWHTVGIKSDGTVVFTGDSFLLRAKEDDSNEYTTTQGWSNVMFISCGSANTVALCTDGTVLSTIVDDATTWDNITDICTGANREIDWTRYHTVGLKTDGTLVAIGNNEYGQCNVIDWSVTIDPSSMKSTETPNAEPMNTPTPKGETMTTKPTTPTPKPTATSTPTETVTQPPYTKEYLDSLMVRIYDFVREHKDDGAYDAELDWDKDGQVKYLDYVKVYNYRKDLYGSN